MMPEPWADVVAGPEGDPLDFRSVLLAASFVPEEDVPAESARREPERVDDAQWVAWSDVETETAWAAAALAIDWGAAEQMASPTR